LRITNNIGFRVTFALTLISWIHYTVIVGQKMRAGGTERTSQ